MHNRRDFVVHRLDDIPIDEFLQLLTHAHTNVHANVNY